MKITKRTFVLSKFHRKSLIEVAGWLGAPNPNKISNHNLVVYCLSGLKLNSTACFSHDVTAIIEYHREKVVEKVNTTSLTVKQKKIFARKNKTNPFYGSKSWRKIRLVVLKLYGKRCQCCGATPDDVDISNNPVVICVDHIKPLKKYPDLALDIDNLQVLCSDCNIGKGSADMTDFRENPLVMMPL